MNETHVPSLGTLTDRVALKRRTTVSEDEGGEVAIFAPIATVWGRVRALGTRELTGEARGQSITHSVVLRYRADLRPGDRIVYRSRQLEIMSAGDLNGRHAYLSCQCSERAVTG